MRIRGQFLTAVLRLRLFHVSLSLCFTGAPFWLKAADCQSSFLCVRSFRSLAGFARVCCVRLVGCVWVWFLGSLVACVVFVCFGSGFGFVVGVRFLLRLILPRPLFSLPYFYSAVLRTCLISLLLFITDSLPLISPYSGLSLSFALAFSLPSLIACTFSFQFPRTSIHQATY